MDYFKKIGCQKFEKYLNESINDISRLGYFSPRTKRSSKRIYKLMRILRLVRENKLTPKLFSKIDTWDKKSVAYWLKNIIWLCENCKSNQGKKFPQGMFFEGDEKVCSECNHILTRRTPGGQSDPFGYTFKKIRNVKK